ncbi:MAG: hypothetical protein WD431_11085, partial [Cyclobacteriaceae bacterium]
MKNQQIETEIEKLKKISRDWHRTRQDKNSAHILLRSISRFNQSFRSEFPSLCDYYVRNSPAEVYITDGIENLEIYANSQLKRKDNDKFEKGLGDVIEGIDMLILKLEEQK